MIILLSVTIHNVAHVCLGHSVHYKCLNYSTTLVFMYNLKLYLIFYYCIVVFVYHCALVLWMRGALSRLLIWYQTDMIRWNGWMPLFCVLTVIVITSMTCPVDVLASPTSTLDTPHNDVTTGSYYPPRDDVITPGESLVVGETEPCSRERMIVCYSSVDSRFNAEAGGLVPNLSDTSLQQLCQYANRTVLNTYSITVVTTI